MTLKLLIRFAGKKTRIERYIYKNQNVLYRYYFIIPLYINSRGRIFKKKKKEKKAIRTRYSKFSSNQRIYFQITSEAITAVLRDIWDFRSNSGYPRERSVGKNEGSMPGPGRAGGDAWQPRATS